ncbi:UDP-N-acetylmuramoyl-tripeptide--D-alanyl-D-alanine ligase [Myroides marinus]|uniref:UDP-N-acetylmuramoyl-tripeptide--D-alanyl-D-alanine ligase n=1 Tax=Myroides marinus TaxID=703342 RepID=A0A1H6VCG6_9FLAO|nr:UDP-N-acetylmuramoyl-tripeptide--D-alanyl-D-alanine ligase [Myroides marinus]MDM1347697.1 UDP-N-acetylmuramoyl-tripeptide--D-alanyl-D-alanine ligase [Myroides marinus]MDM1351370.1 UDP-N-acetylmuramoyl-tripeptide--D-alanyl-D-alanine ligase [Myroides marinus]MDM1354735.1 UDP-N-acetylmuramoyl-tripeptide--D-alanyl-D-alanine ligase [Myroides marinus]MDM1358577.1 UDP-N-acetylmuramoyl-tripeptide--D-alanyl-D-alanine ligase [Myroides marinus]MDM1360400.1 UDP-N-acetylmuramoyl-tripeptide--D-alanyl-D-a
MDITELYQCFLQCDGVSTDTRNIHPNSLFFALKGDNFDANEFAQEALNKGAAYVVMDNKKLVTDPTKMLFVSDTLGALQQLAKYHRQQLGLPIIALTGSNGKTTSKELIATVLSKKYKVTATKGNLNNHIGVPLTLLSITDETDLGIIEMGANHKQEIAMLCELADPDFGYITNFGKAHLEGFGGFEGVIKAKSELYDYLEDNHKTAFVNIDDPRQDAKTITFSRFTFGSDSSADVVIDKFEAQPNATVYYNNDIINSNLTGIYNATNIAAALTIGKFFNVDFSDIKDAITQYIPTNNRSQWITKDQSMILLDAYNANPSSMDAVLTNFDQLKDDRNKIFILGDMLELGQEGLKEHKNIVERLDKVANKTVYFIGKEFSKASINTNFKDIYFFETFDIFKKHIEETSNEIFKNKLILIKGSRGIALERSLELI